MWYNINRKGVLKMIDIKIDKTVGVNGDYAAFISFPYNGSLISIIRELPERRWDKEAKTWEIPLNKLMDTMQQFGNKSMRITGYVEKDKPFTYELPAGFSFLTDPYKHQVEGLQYGMQNDRFVLGDQQGLGKTKQVIDIAIARRLTHGYKHCLIIACVNGLKWNWLDECKTHANEEAYVLGARRNSKGKLKVAGNATKMQDLINPPDNYFLITNVESLRSTDIAEKIAELCKNGQIDMIAVDEIHKCKNPSSQQGKGLLKIQSESMIAMSGTPLLERPLDLYIIFRWLGYEKHSFFQFKKHYCVMGGFNGYQVVAYKNMGELRQKLSAIMLRRLKKDVLDLPPKIYVTEYVEMNKAQQLVYDEVRMDILENIDQVKISPNPLAQLIRLRQATGWTGILSSTVKESAKIDRMQELVEEAIEDGHKIIIYSQWTQITDVIRQKLTEMKIKHTYITGQNKDDVNHDNEHLFQDDPNCKVLVGTTGALGTGFTLTAATYEIFMDEPWNKKEKEQAEDRAHRIGTTDPVIIKTLITKDTIDERIQQIVLKKGAMSDAIVDGKVDVMDTNMISFLLS